MLLSFSRTKEWNLRAAVMMVVNCNYNTNRCWLVAAIWLLYLVGGSCRILVNPDFMEFRANRNWMKILALIQRHKVAARTRARYGNWKSRNYKSNKYWRRRGSILQKGTLSRVVRRIHSKTQTKKVANTLNLILAQRRSALTAMKRKLRHQLMYIARGSSVLWMQAQVK